MSGVWVGEVAADDTRELRRAVLRPHLRLDDPLPGDDQPDAIHVAAVDDRVVVSTCLVFTDTADWLPVAVPASSQWRLRSMATVAALRGQGLGALVLAGAVSAVQRRGARALWAHARISAEPFYLANGWRTEGDEFTENDLPHRNIWREVDTSTS